MKTTIVVSQPVSQANLFTDQAWKSVEQVISFAGPAHFHITAYENQNNIDCGGSLDPFTKQAHKPRHQFTKLAYFQKWQMKTEIKFIVETSTYPSCLSSHPLKRASLSHYFIRP